MNATLAIFVLAAMPPGIMGTAHWYAVRAQDRHIWCTVLFDNRVRDAAKVVADHRERFHVSVVQQMDGATKGYRGRVAMKHLPAIERDRRVQSVHHYEHDEFLHIA